MSLEEILDAQREFAKRVSIPGDRNERILALCRAILHEVIELEDEIQWKWWKKRRQIDEMHLREEVIDVLHFLLQIFIELGMSARDIEEEYMKKMRINHMRQDNGY